MQGNISLEGAVDYHAHVGPSRVTRRVDGYEHAVESAEAGLDAVVLKEHHLPTVYGVPFIERLLDRDGIEIDVLGSLVCNYCVGGFNPVAVETAIEYGARVIWAPTVDARNHAEKRGIGDHLDAVITPRLRRRGGIAALDDDGALRPAVRECLDVIVEHDVVLSMGHLSFEETRTMAEYVADRGHDRIVIDAPNYFIPDFDLDQQRELVGLGATLNFMFLALSPKYHYLTPAELHDNIREIGAEHCIVSSDMGQVANPSGPEGLRIMGELLLEAGLLREEYRLMVERNPKRLLDL